MIPSSVSTPDTSTHEGKGYSLSFWSRGVTEPPQGIVHIESEIKVFAGHIEIIFIQSCPILGLVGYLITTLLQTGSALLSEGPLVRRPVSPKAR